VTVERSDTNGRDLATDNTTIAGTAVDRYPLAVRRWINVRTIIPVLVLLTAVVIFFTVYEGRPHSTPVGMEAQQTTEQWLTTIHERAQNGYWIVVRGTHIGDQVVAAGSAAELTHAAVFDSAEDEIIEAHGTGVTVAPLRELIAQAWRVQIVRPRDYTEELGAAAVARARSRLGSSYDWLGTIGLQQERRFYCTELCVDAYDARTRGWMPPGVIHPEHMTRYGELVWDSGGRPDDNPTVRTSAELRGRFAQRIEDARGVAYAATVAPGIYRGGQPDAQGVEWLDELGIKTVINLRHYHGDTEGERVRAAGMRYVRIPLESTDPPTDAQVRQFLSIVNDPEQHPVYIHCLHGVDRTGAMLAVYRIREQGWNNGDALAEMEHFGAHGILHDLRRFVGSYTPSRTR
jgi:tyrosine-protein phosphatase SIW14